MHQGRRHEPAATALPAEARSRRALLALLCLAQLMVILDISAVNVALPEMADGLAIGAGATAVLRPGGDHVMLMKLQRPLVAGGTVSLRLTFERSGERTVTATVTDDGAGAHGGH